MSAEVVNLATASAPVLAVDAKVVEYLREMLQVAEAGGIQGIAIVTVESDGAGSLVGCGQGWAGEGLQQNVHAAIGSAVILQQRLLQMVQL